MADLQQLGPSERATALASHDDLAGAALSGLDLSDCDLTGASLDDVVFRAARFDNGCLDRASLRRADLSGASLAGVRASELDAREALFEDAILTGAMLRFADLRHALFDGANLQRADLWGAKLGGVEAPDADFSGAILQEAILTGADLSGTRLNNASLQKADLTGAKIRGADLTGCAMSGTNLTTADLTGARLRELDLASCDLRHVRLADAWLDRTRLRLDQLGGAAGEEVAREWEAARRAYGGLEQNFRTLGDPDAASWCYKRGRRMAKYEARRLAWHAAKNLRPREFLLNASTASADSFAEWLCDYGESLPRVVRAYVTVLLGFSLYYRQTGSLLRTVPAPHGATLVPDTSWLDVIGFSFLTMCTSSTPDTDLKLASHVVAYVGSLQYVVGVLLIGLFGFVLGNRIRR